MKALLKHSAWLAGLAAAALFMGGCQCCPPAGSVQTKESQAAMTPQQALSELRGGNARFAAGKPRTRNFPAQVKATASGQYPFAVVLNLPGFPPAD